MGDVGHKYIEAVYVFLDSLDYLAKHEGYRGSQFFIAESLIRGTQERFVMLAREWGLVEEVESEESVQLTSRGLSYVGLWADEHATRNARPNSARVEELAFVSGLCEFLRDLELEEKRFDAFEKPAAEERRKAEIGDLEDLTDTVWELMGEPSLPDRKFHDLAYLLGLVDVELPDTFDVDEKAIVSINQRGLAYLARWSDEVVLTSDDMPAAGAAETEQETVDDALHGRAQDVLVAMLQLGAFDSDNRKTTAAIAVKALGGGTDANALKNVMADLKTREYVLSKTGSGGGCWLTPKGHERAEKLRGKS